MSPSVREYVKIYRNSGTFDKHLVWQINQGCFHNALLKQSKD